MSRSADCQQSAGSSEDQIPLQKAATPLTASTMLNCLQKRSSSNTQYRERRLGQASSVRARFTHLVKRSQEPRHFWAAWYMLSQ